MGKILISIIAVTVLLITPASALAPDQKYYETIKNHLARHKLSLAEKHSYRFLKQYPKSRLVPDVRLILAEIEQDPRVAIEKYRKLIRIYRYYKRKDYLYIKICEILYLTSQWKELERETSRALGTLKKSEYLDTLRLYRVIACINDGRLSTAEKECLYLIDNNHGYDSLARALLLLAYINKKTYGFSRKYIYSLREVISGFHDSAIIQTALYLLGEFYEARKDFDKAFSAYSDIIDRYPRSPEAADAARRIQEIRKHKPRRVFYMPDKKIIENTETIDIKPFIDLPDKDDSITYYSLSIGPLTSVKTLKRIKNMIKSMGRIRTVRMRRGFRLYIGKYSDTDTALRIKIRLAEEFGINGRIVRISGSERKKYIYGD